jgi:hypothetical protein
MAFVSDHLIDNKVGWNKRVNLRLIRKSTTKRRSEGLPPSQCVSLYGLFLSLAICLQPFQLSKRNACSIRKTSKKLQPIIEFVMIKKIILAQGPLLFL